MRKIVLLCLSLVVFATHFAFAGMERKATPEATTGVVTGRVLVKDSVPLAWGEVMFYNVAAGPPPSPNSYDRVPDVVRSTDAEGKFRVSLPAATYYLSVVKRMSGDRFGSPEVGDYVLLLRDEKGLLKRYTVNAGETLDVGSISGAVPVTAKDLAKPITRAVITGAVYTTEGVPVSDAVVIAYLTASVQGKPLFVSEKTTKDGKYVLKLSPGTYYLRARNNLTGGPPEPGQIVGFYGEGEPFPVQVKDGQAVQGVDFTVILFEGRGPRSRAVE